MGSQAGSDSGTFVGKGNRSSFPCKCVAGLEAIALCDGMFKVRSLEVDGYLGKHSTFFV